MQECCCDIRMFNDCLNNANLRNTNFRNANSAETLNMIKKYLYTIVSHDVLLTRSIMEHLFIMEKEAEALEEARLLLKIREKEKAAKEKQILDEQRSYIKANGFMFSLVFQDGNVGRDEKHWHGKECYPVKGVYGNYDSYKVVSNMSNGVTIGELLKSYYEHGGNKGKKVVSEKCSESVTSGCGFVLLSQYQSIHGEDYNSVKVISDVCDGVTLGELLRHYNRS